MFKSIQAAGILAAVASASALADSHCELLYRNGTDGAALEGSKSALVDAISQGGSIRIGWAIDLNNDGEGELIHWADASFITLYGDEVYSQIAGIHIQSPRPDDQTVVLIDRDIQWRGMIDTTGRVQNAFTNDMRVPGETRAVVTWCVER